MGGVMYWMLTGSEAGGCHRARRDDPQISARSLRKCRTLQPGFSRCRRLGTEPGRAPAPPVRRRIHEPPDRICPTRGRTTTVPAHCRFRPCGRMPVMSRLRAVCAVGGPPHYPRRSIRNSCARWRANWPSASGRWPRYWSRKPPRNSRPLRQWFESVAAEIEDEAERAKFTRRLRGGDPAALLPSFRRIANRVHQLAAARFDMAVPRKSRKRLAQHIGALARVVGEKGGDEAARDESELYLRWRTRSRTPTTARPLSKGHFHLRPTGLTAFRRTKGRRFSGPRARLHQNGEPTLCTMTETVFAVAKFLRLSVRFVLRHRQAVLRQLDKLICVNWTFPKISYRFDS